MKITIHRGASQIGGCVTEIRTEKARILIDLGSNLPGSDKPDFTTEEIKRLTDGVDAIFYTHYHGDHIGFHNLVNPEKQYIGEGAKEVLEWKHKVLARHNEDKSYLEAVQKMKCYKPEETFTISDDLKITPYYCSHSAFDSYMFLIVAEEKNILHTGDFRKHGYMGKALIPVLRKYIHQVDILITEGTMLSRSSEKVKPECEIQNEIAGVLRNHKYVFALTSSTDIDRLASMKEACATAHRNLLADKYQKGVMDIFTKYTTSPLYNFNSTFNFNGNSLIENQKIVWKMKHEGFLLPIRCSGEWLIRMMMDKYNDEEPHLIYSMWSGYYKGTEEQQIKEALTIRSLFKPENIHDIHTSGHADCETLAEVCRKVNPRLAIIPIHKDEKSDYRTLDIPQNLKDKVITESMVVDGVEIEIKPAFN